MSHAWDDYISEGSEGIGKGIGAGEGEGEGIGTKPRVNNHARVDLIHQGLNSLGLKCWIDQTGEGEGGGEMWGDLSTRMSEGIDASTVVLIHLTKEYVRKVAGP